jgi:hypothetical protein
MTYVAAEARQEMLDEIVGAAAEIGHALAAVGAAYEQLDEQSADRLEEALFGPIQSAYGRIKRTHSEFADRHGLPRATFESGHAGLPSTGAAGFVTNAVDAVERADYRLSELQDSMRPVEIGDPELRAGLSEVRTLLDGVRRNAREFTRTLGR